MSLALFLALIAGYTDVIVYFAMQMWAANMTGMLIFFVVALTKHEYAFAAQHVGAVVVFTSGVIAARRGRRLLQPRPEAALGLPALLVAAAIPIFPGLAGFYLIAFAMGAQNGAVHSFGGVAVYTTFITGNLERLGEGIGDPNPSKGPGLVLAVIVAYAAGALLGAYARIVTPLALAATPIGLALAASFARWALRKRA